MAKRIRSIAIQTTSESTRVYDLMNAMDSTRRGLTRLSDLALNGEETRLVGDMISLYNKLTRLDTIVEADNIIRDRETVTEENRYSYLLDNRDRIINRRDELQNVKIHNVASVLANEFHVSLPNMQRFLHDESIIDVPTYTDAERAERQNVNDWVSNIVNGRYDDAELVSAYGSKNFGPMLDRLMTDFFANERDTVELAGWILSESDVDNLNATKFADIVVASWQSHLASIAKAAYNNHNDQTSNPNLAAIKAVRNIAGWDLRQSKEFVEKCLGI